MSKGRGFEVDGRGRLSHGIEGRWRDIETTTRRNRALRGLDVDVDGERQVSPMGTVFLLMYSFILYFFSFPFSGLIGLGHTSLSFLSLHGGVLEKRIVFALFLSLSYSLGFPFATASSTTS